MMVLGPEVSLKDWLLLSAEMAHGTVCTFSRTTTWNVPVEKLVLWYAFLLYNIANELVAAVALPQVSITQTVHVCVHIMC